MDKITTIVEEDLETIGPGDDLFVKIPVKGFKIGDCVKVEYRIAKAEPELDPAFYLPEPEPVTVDEMLEFFKSHKML